MKKDWIARQIKAEVAVGAFLVLIFLALGYFTIILTRDKWFKPKDSVEVVFKNVRGLREGDSVVIRGMTVGKVKELRLLKDGVHVVAALQETANLREGYRVRIVPTSILGGLYLEIDEGAETNAALPAGAVLAGVKPTDLMSDASDLVGALKDGLVDGGMIENLRVTSEKIRLISERLEAGEGSLGKLLSKDETVYNDLAATIKSFREVTDRIEKGEGMLGKLVSKDDKLYEDLAATARSLRTVTEGLESGKGVLGRLLTDEEMSKQVSETMTEIRAAVDDYRESSPVVTFSSIFFGAF